MGHHRDPVRAAQGMPEPDFQRGISFRQFVEYILSVEPEELDVLDRKVMQLEIEIEAIKREKDTKKLEFLKKELANFKEKRNEINAKWTSEKEIVDKVQSTKECIEKLKLDAERAEREGNYGEVAEIRYGKIKEEEEQLVIYQKEMDSQENSLIKEEDSDHKN